MLLPPQFTPRHVRTSSHFAMKFSSLGLAWFAHAKAGGSGKGTGTSSARSGSDWAIPMLPFWSPTTNVAAERYFLRTSS